MESHTLGDAKFKTFKLPHKPSTGIWHLQINIYIGDAVNSLFCMEWVKLVLAFSLPYNEVKYTQKGPIWMFQNIILIYLNIVRVK